MEEKYNKKIVKTEIKQGVIKTHIDLFNKAN